MLFCLSALVIICSVRLIFSASKNYCGVTVQSIKSLIANTLWRHESACRHRYGTCRYIIYHWKAIINPEFGVLLYYY